MYSSTTVKRVLILGGGFGGLYAALELEKTLARDLDVEVTLVTPPYPCIRRRTAGGGTGTHVAK
jgi:cation diffusion facilitator CzcD-associated flavoprotein CzcO